MLAHKDQENLINDHLRAAASKQLNQSTRTAPPKTPGNKYPKTPIKIPLQDENGPVGFGGKSVLGTKGRGANENLVTGRTGKTFDKSDFVTPLGTTMRNRAPLGAKTTNAKAKAFQTPSGPVFGKSPEKTQVKQTSTRRQKPKISHAETIKLDIHGDESPLREREVEYCPPKPQDLPYESDVFPEGCLDYSPLKGANLMRGWQDYYMNPIDENGLTALDRKMEADKARSFKEMDERVRRDLEEEWTIGDVPETFAYKRQKELAALKAKEEAKTSKLAPRAPATIASRKAASALSVVPPTIPVVAKVPKSTSTSKPSFLGRKKLVVPTPANPSEMRHTAATAASRSTIGYTKGRNASSLLNAGFMKPRVLARSVSNVSTGSDTTITPENYAKKEDDGTEQWRRLKLLGAFDTDDESLEPGLRGELPDCLREEDEDEEFIMTLGPAI